MNKLLHIKPEWTGHPYCWALNCKTKKCAFVFSRLRHDGSVRSNSESTLYYWGRSSWTFHLQHLTQLHPLQRRTADPEHRVRTQNTHMHILLNDSVTPFIQHSHPVSVSASFIRLASLQNTPSAWPSGSCRIHPGSPSLSGSSQTMTSSPRWEWCWTVSAWMLE